MAYLTNNELTDIVVEYGQAGQNAIHARHVYQEQFSNHRIPKIRTIMRIVQHLRDHGSNAKYKIVVYNVVLQIWRKVF
jgi:hypothetical protein